LFLLILKNSIFSPECWCVAWLFMRMTYDLGPLTLGQVGNDPMALQNSQISIHIWWFSFSRWRGYRKDLLIHFSEKDKYQEKSDDSLFWKGQIFKIWPFSFFGKNKLLKSIHSIFREGQILKIWDFSFSRGNVSKKIWCYE